MRTLRLFIPGSGLFMLAKVLGVPMDELFPSEKFIGSPEFKRN